MLRVREPADQEVQLVFTHALADCKVRPLCYTRLLSSSGQGLGERTTSV